MLRRTSLGVVGIVLGLAFEPVDGQEVFEPGIALVGELLRNGDAIYVNSLVTAEDRSRGAFRREVLGAAAERALRRDGLAARDVSSLRPRRGGVAGLIVEAITFPTGDQCAISLNVQLQVQRGQLVILAADTTTLMVWPWPVHVARVRQTVEENVSVIPNAIAAHLDSD